MSTILDTINEYEAKALDQLAKLQADVLEYVKKAVAAIEERMPEIEIPENEILEKIPSLQAVVDTQFAFSKKLLANQEKFAKNVVKAVKPLTLETLAAKPAETKAA